MLQFARENMKASVQGDSLALRQQDKYHTNLREATRIWQGNVNIFIARKDDKNREAIHIPVAKLWLKVAC